jgi:hypothetical protein
MKPGRKTGPRLYGGLPERRYRRRTRSIKPEGEVLHSQVGEDALAFTTLPSRYSTLTKIIILLTVDLHRTCSVKSDLGKNPAGQSAQVQVILILVKNQIKCTSLKSTLLYLCFPWHYTSLCAARSTFQGLNASPIPAILTGLCYHRKSRLRPRVRRRCLRWPRSSTLKEEDM